MESNKKEAVQAEAMVVAMDEAAETSTCKPQ